MKKFVVKVPASSANLGPGFDTLGLGLSLYLTLKGSLSNSTSPSITLSSSSNDIPLDPNENLITKTALAVLSKEKKNQTFTANIEILNDIPLGRGMGSSAAAIVAGVVLASILIGETWTKSKVLNYALCFEDHPDNISASVYGNLTSSMVNEQECATNVIDLNEKIKAIVLIPSVSLATTKARQVLPQSYSTTDVVHNLQRATFLITELQKKDPQGTLVYNSMEDRMHHPYRSSLIPWFKVLKSEMNPANTPGMLGIAVSGAGPSVLVLAKSNYNEIVGRIQSFVADNLQKEVSFKVNIFDIDSEGFTIQQ